MVWEKQEGGNIWIPKKEGEEITGKVIAISEGQFGKQASIQLSNGEVVLTPSHKVLQARMVKVKVGDEVKIVAGKKDLPKVKGYKETQLYDVYINR